MSSKSPSFIPYKPIQVDEDSLEIRISELNKKIQLRRSIRHFSSKSISKESIEGLIKIAGSAPSGAHKQPWTFVAVSDPTIKSKIRMAAEEEEKAFYSERATEEWLKDLAPLGTDWNKEFLEKAPWLIIAFRKSYENSPEGRKKNYYVQESIGIACGFLITAIHQAGLVTLTHTPSPMGFLSNILDRPENEKPFLLLPVGYPDENAEVPNLERKDLGEISVFK